MQQQQPNTSWDRIVGLTFSLAACWFFSATALILLDMKSNLAIDALSAETLEVRDGIEESIVPWLDGMPVFVFFLLIVVSLLYRLDSNNKFGWLAKWGSTCLAAFIMEAFRMIVYGATLRFQIHTLLVMGFSAPLILITHEVSRSISTPLGIAGIRASALWGLIVFVMMCSVYLLFMRAIDAQCTLKTGSSCVTNDVRSKVEDIYIPANVGDAKGSPHPMPLSAGFQLEKLDVKISNVVGDIDGNGSTDFVYFDSDLRSTFFLNSKGTLRATKFGLDRLLDFPTAQIVMADLNRDGLMDLVAVRRDFSPNLLHRFISSSVYYPFVDKRFSLEVFFQINPGVWQNATANMFPGKRPSGFQKVEPIIFADLNGDGFLDFIWQQYPHRLFGSLNAVYIRGSDGRYVDRMAEFFDWHTSKIMPEGGDFADITGDGEVDLFAFGYPYIARESRFFRACGEQYAHIPCKVSRRMEEGGTFIDIGGAPHLAVAYWGTREVLPQKALHFFKAMPTGDLVPLANESQGAFRGVNTYLVGKDLDLDGTEEILTSQPTRLLTWNKGRFWDALPFIAPKLRGKRVHAIGFVDFDDDGDIDILLDVEGEKTSHLLRNNLNPKSFLRVAARSADGSDAQFGATLTFKSSDGEETWWRAYRPRRGYWGDTDPKIVVRPRAGQEYSVKACFPSISTNDPAKIYSTPSFKIQISMTDKRCITYKLSILQDDTKIDLTLLAGGTGFKVQQIASNGDMSKVEANQTLSPVHRRRPQPFE